MIDIDSREIYRGAWGLLGQWYCVPVDMTDDEQTELLQMAASDIAFDKKGCPPEYIRDRLFGGFICGDSERRRHIYFSTGDYSYISAEHGEFWPMEANERAARYEDLLRENGDQPIPDPLGPFCGDRP